MFDSDERVVGESCLSWCCDICGAEAVLSECEVCLGDQVSEECDQVKMLDRKSRCFSFRGSYREERAANSEEEKGWKLQAPSSHTNIDITSVAIIS